MTNKTRIAIFTDSFLPGVGGTENAVFLYAKELSKTHNIRIYCPNYKGKNNNLKLSFDVVRVKSVRVTDNDFLSLPKHDKSFQDNIKKFAPDIIHVMTIGPLARYISKYALLNNIPFVQTVHSRYSQMYRTNFKIKFLADAFVSHLAKYLPYAKNVVAVSESLKTDMREFGIDCPISVIKNGMDYTFLDKTYQSENKLKLLYVGMLIKYKRLDFSLEVVKKLKEKGIDFEFLVVGGGNYGRHLKRTVKKYGLSDNVKFLGKISDREKLGEIYFNSDLLLFPSIVDNDPIVVLEAGANKTPALVCEKTGASERISDGLNGFTCENDVDSFVNKIIYLMGNKELLQNVSENAHTVITSWKETVEKYSDIYDNVIKSKETKTIEIFRKKDNKNGNLRRTGKAWTNRTSN